MSDRADWTEEKEMAAFRPGQQVELKQRPGLRSTVIGYDPMMVPPIILDNDPLPRYPEELTLLSQSAVIFNWFDRSSRRRLTGHKVA